jgi:hypothetical protein
MSCTKKRKTPLMEYCSCSLQTKNALRQWLSPSWWETETHITIQQKIHWQQFQQNVSCEWSLCACIIFLVLEKIRKSGKGTFFLQTSEHSFSFAVSNFKLSSVVFRVQSTWVSIPFVFQEAWVSCANWLHRWSGYPFTWTQTRGQPCSPTLKWISSSYFVPGIKFDFAVVYWYFYGIMVYCYSRPMVFLWYTGISMVLAPHPQEDNIFDHYIY